MIFAEDIAARQESLGPGPRQLKFTNIISGKYNSTPTSIRKIRKKYCSK